MTKQEAARIAHDNLLLTIDRMKDEELLVLDFIASRLLAGQTLYAPLDLVNDKRDLDMMRAEEQADDVNYQGMQVIKRALLAGLEDTKPHVTLRADVAEAAE